MEELLDEWSKFKGKLFFVQITEREFLYNNTGTGKNIFFLLGYKRILSCLPILVQVNLIRKEYVFF